MAIVHNSGNTPYWELSLIGQFRAIDRQKARLFAQAVANAASALGLNDCGYDVRQMSEDIVTDDQARMRLLDVTWRPEWGPKPWEEHESSGSDALGTQGELEAGPRGE